MKTLMNHPDIELYTGYFAKLVVYKQHRLYPVSIARYMPRGVVIPELPSAAPSQELLRAYKTGTVTTTEYDAIYRNDLITNFNPAHLQEIIDTARRMSYQGVVFVCYERPESFCHRHIFADYLNKNFGENVTEFKV